jgi:hypothetical protein
MSSGPAVLADDHPLVDLGGRTDEQLGAFDERRDRIRPRLARPIGDEDAAGPMGDLARDRPVVKDAWE